MKISKQAFLKVWVLSIIIFTVFTSASYAQVDRDELDNLPPVVFINYEGPHARIDTREQIRQIGVVLGQRIAESERGIAPALAEMSIEQRREYSYRFEAGASNRYFVIHSVSGTEGGKLDADIFGLGVDAGVDHIRNLRWIIQGYLQAAYDYSERDAALLSEYITVYNAVYRGNWDYFTERYKTPVIGHLTRERAGLSIRYDEWPGRTLIVIPLGHGGISSIDTAAISDSRVIEEMRKEEDQSVPQRQGMVDLQEREAENARQQAQAERERIRQEEQRLAEERARAEQERQNIERERQRLQEEQQAGTITEEQAREAEDEIDRMEQEAEQRDQEIARQEDELDQRRDEAQRLEDFAERRIDDAQQGRETIARDQQTAIAQEIVTVILGITIEREEPPMGRLVRFDPVTRRETRRSPLDTVHVRTVTFINGKIIAIAGENKGEGAVRLIEITQDTLVMAKQGDDDIRTGSLIWASGNDIYAIMVDLEEASEEETEEDTKEDSKCYLGRFDVNLILQAKSSVTVHREASVSIQQGQLLTQREDGSPLILNPASLSEIF
jgi:multidrug efflux pump subunit AcrA (membrane-fusion protein)